LRAESVVQSIQRKGFELRPAQHFSDQASSAGVRPWLLAAGLWRVRGSFAMFEVKGQV
jgi:hypothetical protein